MTENTMNSEGTILSEGLVAIRKLRQDASELYSSRTRIENAKALAQQTEKAIKSKEKLLSDEITQSVKKRQEEIERSFDGEISKLQTRSKNVKTKKGEAKQKEIKLRIRRETAEEKEQIRQLKLEIRTNFKKEGIHRIINTKLFYSLFIPHCMSDWLLLVVSFILAILGIPGTTYFHLFPEKFKNSLGMLLMFFGFVVIYVLLYVVISHRTKGSHKECFDKVKELRTRIWEAKKEIKRISKAIRKDKDESEYHLHHYDNEMQDITEDIARVLEEKKIALAEFEATASKVLEASIKEKYQDELSGLQDQLQRARDEEKSSVQRDKELSILFAKEYEPYLGKECLSLDVIDRLEARLESGEALTIAQAMKLYQEDKEREELEKKQKK